MRACVSSLLCFIISSFLEVQAADFRVVKRKGRVQVLELGSVEWEPLRSKTLRHGALIAVGDGASLELTHLVSGTKQKERMRIEQPMILRLDEGLLRDFRYRDYAIDRLFVGSKSETTAVKQKPVLTLRDALQRFMIRYLGTDIPQGRQVDPETPAMSAGKTLIPIDLYAPVDQSVFFLEQGQSEITLRWLPLPGNSTYKVYSWLNGENRSDPLYETQENSGTIRFQKPGQYRIMVSNADGTARSSTLSIQVLVPRVASEARESFLKSALRRDKMGLIPRVPAPQTEIFQGKNSPALVSFAWSDDQPLGLDELYILQLKEEKGQLFRVKSQSLWVQTELPVGRYRWHVSRENRLTGEVSKDTGARWLLEVKPYEAQQLALALRQALNERTSLRQTFILDLAR
jgi:hypothetical protein